MYLNFQHREFINSKLINSLAWLKNNFPCEFRLTGSIPLIWANILKRPAHDIDIIVKVRDRQKIFNCKLLQFADTTLIQEQYATDPRAGYQMLTIETSNGIKVNVFFVDEFDFACYELYDFKIADNNLAFLQKARCISNDLKSITFKNNQVFRIKKHWKDIEDYLSILITEDWQKEALGIKK